MGQAQHQFLVTLTEINCGECGGTYAINERYRKQAFEHGSSWHCPYCKVAWGYNYDDSPLEEAKKEAAHQKQLAGKERKKREWAEQETKHVEARRRGEKAAKTKIKNRIANGVCPCCQRSFKNLHRHMQNKHPDYSTSD